MKRGNRLEGTRVVSLLLLASSFGKAFDRFEESRSGDVPFENEGQDFEGWEINLHIPFSLFLVLAFSLFSLLDTRERDNETHNHLPYRTVKRVILFDVHVSLASSGWKANDDIFLSEMRDLFSLSGNKRHNRDEFIYFFSPSY